MTRSRTKIRPRASTARARSLATRTTRRSRRSARTPASGLAMVGKRRATRAPPTAEALPVIWTISTTSATIETLSPRKETPWPIQSRKKRLFPRSESPRPFILPRKKGVRSPAPHRGSRILQCNARGVFSPRPRLTTTRPAEQSQIGSLGEPPVQLPCFAPFSGREPGHQGPGSRGVEPVSGSALHRRELAGAQPQGAIPNEGREEPLGHIRVPGGELQAGDARRDVRVLGGGSAGDARRAGGEVFDQEGQ